MISQGDGSCNVVDVMRPKQRLVMDYKLNYRGVLFAVTRRVIAKWTQNGNQNLLASSFRYDFLSREVFAHLDLTDYRSTLVYRLVQHEQQKYVRAA